MNLLYQLVAKLKLGSQHKQSTVETRVNELCLVVLDLFIQEGYIKGYKKYRVENLKHLKKNQTRKLKNKSNDINSGDSSVIIYLKTDRYNRLGLLESLSAFSRPGTPRYLSVSKIIEILPKYRLLLVSTNHGVLTGLQAAKRSLGGLMILQIV